uniref:Uncharacterized protein n=1 Tax=Panagrellus redivivus TaxID=6233 RepID=A0A7E4URK1_PANRE
MSGLKLLIFVYIFYASILLINVCAAPFGRVEQNRFNTRHAVGFDSSPIADNNEFEQNTVNKRVHGLSRLRMMGIVGRPHPDDSQKVDKRVHNLSLLRMGKLFKPNSSQVKRHTSPSLWRILADADNYALE